MTTTAAATALGLGSTTGRIAPGYRADLIVVGGDPLSDLDALKNVTAVFASGRRHDPKAPVE